MAQTTSITTTLIAELVSQIGAIDFTDTGTLTSNSLIYGFDKNAQQKPLTDVCIYEGSPPGPNAEEFASKNVKNRYNFICRIRAFGGDGRLEKATEDVRYLREQIVFKLQDNYNNAVWSNYRGFLDDRTIQPQTMRYDENYYVQEINFTINTIRIQASC